MKSWAEQYMKMKPITETQRRYFIKETQKYVLVANENGDAICTSCASDLHLGKTKHLDSIECPSCHKQMTIHHTWRTAQYPKSYGWHCVAKAIDNHTICLRYIEVIDNHVEERGRIFIDEYKNNMEYWCNSIWQKDWTKGKSPFFIKPNVFNGYGSEAVYNAKPYMKTWFKECSKLSCFGKFNPIEKAWDNTRIPSQMHYLIRSAKVNEMLINAGLKELANDHLYYYMYRNNDHSYPVNNKKSNLIEVLKLNKQSFKFWKEKPTIENLKLYQKWSNKYGAQKVRDVINKMRYSFDVNNYLTNLSMAIKLINKPVKSIENYIMKEKIEIRDYVDYLKIVNELGYSMKDKQYIMPRDFAKDKKRVCDEQNSLADEKWISSMNAKSAIMKLISDELRKMPDLEKYTAGSKGLFVYVPENAREMLHEGRELHNCLQNYVTRVAEKKTLIFFIRQLENPTAPFVAMEYCNGQIIQCRYDNNEDVRSKDDEQSKNIINFAEALANVLKNNKVLVA